MIMLWHDHALLLLTRSSKICPFYTWLRHFLSVPGIPRSENLHRLPLSTS
ncbi:hypothetical protein HanIR_Chr16g0812141 [Helianthus annuus]|nr:hypothetical protein HanIR_Chr16g0812141 [Helianthus annuus]